MMRMSSRGILALFLLLSVLAVRPVRAQKSLSDGVDDLASKLATSYGEAKKGRVAILPFRLLEGGENLLGTYLADSLTNSFFNVGYRDIVERQMLDRAIKELKLQYTGMIDPESAKKVGKFLHADLVVGGTLSDLLGKVEVTCRMFAVETGEIVAVAKTELLKDDNVKTMMGRRGSSGSAGGDSERDSEDGVSGEPESSGTVYTQKVDGLSFRLHGCAHRGSELSCELGVTALNKDETVNLYGTSRLVDLQGHESRVARFMIGKRRAGSRFELQLVRGIEISVLLRIDGVDSEAQKARMVEIAFRREGGVASKARFQNVTLE